MPEPANETLETSLGAIAITHFDNGDAMLRWARNDDLSDAVRAIFAGRVAWKPKYRAWVLPAKHLDPVIAELSRL